ncbi:Clavaminate synthase-like protein [Massarina eburnea CBS 473.64]|uniref:Clavaminate synthase-like protein n=1 Tax=Massarina eburnea CBS 473.64 TaxID=1395130 RepID=A0A6A6RRA1_9PLEO|nr:Clavaminate synthase-like protein [Massarina eburnea CBS 473.64]
MFERFNFNEYQTANGPRRQEFCEKLVASLQKYGFVRLVSHGVQNDLIDRVFDAGRQFYHLPLAEKMKSPHPPTAHPHRGFTPVGVENISSISEFGRDENAPALPLLKDMKESYDMGSERDELYSNIWPPEGVCDAFQPAFSEFFQSCYDAENMILDAISEGLGLARDTLRKMHAKQHNELRCTHYPTVQRDAFSHSTRIAAHTDFGTITLLFQDHVGGLQVEFPDDSGEFAPIASGGPHECILNVGDCLRQWTGIRSARHRVDLPDGAKNVVEERFSIAYFAKPDRDASLHPLLDELRRGEDAAVTYPTAGEFQNMRIAATY